MKDFDISNSEFAHLIDEWVRNERDWMIAEAGAQNAIQGMNINDILYVFDDLMKATFVYNKDLYKAVLRELREY